MNFTSNVPVGTEVATTLPFRSSSSDAIYECRIYKNGTTSCNCPGWTRQIKAGVRSCKHTREADVKKGPILAALGMSVEEVVKLGALPAMSGKTRAAVHAPEVAKPIRRFDLDA